MDRSLLMKYSVVKKKEYKYLFSICTLVTDFTQYDEMLKSFESNGFNATDCEYLCLDNSVENKFDAYDAINIFITSANGKYVIVCHQDVILLDDNLTDLLSCLEGVAAVDENWGLIGNAGGKNFNELAIRISDPHGENTSTGGPFPVKVTSLDENFILIRAEANLVASRDIGGFHLYGADLCILASIVGYSAYVVDFHLKHLSAGNAGFKNDQSVYSFHQTKKRFICKYNVAFRSRLIVTTCARMYLSGVNFFVIAFNSKILMKVVRKISKLFAS